MNTSQRARAEGPCKDQYREGEAAGRGPLYLDSLNIGNLSTGVFTGSIKSREVGRSI